jgi:hypothetical protein
VTGLIGGVIPKHSEKNLPHYQFVHHEFHMDCPRTELGLPWLINHLKYGPLEAPALYRRHSGYQSLNIDLEVSCFA